ELEAGRQAALEDRVHVADAREPVCEGALGAAAAAKLRKDEVAPVEEVVELADLDEIRRLAGAVVELVANQRLAAGLARLVAVVEEALGDPDDPAAVLRRDEKAHDLPPVIGGVPADRPVAQRGDDIAPVAAGIDAPGGRRDDAAPHLAARTFEAQVEIGAE